jgi:D-alanyl-lipoteichoic acid acyltransferase DltB (MBOAT superfamily)
MGRIVLPLGISFYTFTQIAFLVDAYRGKVRDPQSGFTTLYSSLIFPHLIAGPILHHSEMRPQFRQTSVYEHIAENFASA